MYARVAEVVEKTRGSVGRISLDRVCQRVRAHCIIFSPPRQL